MSETMRNPGEAPTAQQTGEPGRVGSLVRFAAKIPRRGFLLAKAAHRFAMNKGGWHRAPFAAMSRSWQLLRSNGVEGFMTRLKMFLCQVSRSDKLPFSTHLSRDQAEQVHEVLDRQPRFSIVIPVYKVDPKWLELCIGSVANQYYPNWEAILVDDCSHDPALTTLMANWCRRDSRFRLLELKENLNISGATNAGIEAATGELIGFLDHDDELTPDALTWFAASQSEHPDAKWFYSDEAIIHPDGRCKNLHLKPDYSPEFLLAAMYPCHFSVYDADLLKSVGGLRLGFEGAQDYDLALRVSETVERDQVVHIPRVLYHWRAIETSTARDVEVKPLAQKAGLNAVEEALSRRGIQGKVKPSGNCASMFEIALTPRNTPKVTIIIPTRNGFEDLQTCLCSLREKTRYPNCEVVVIDNQSDDPQLLSFLKSEETAGRLRVQNFDRPFNHSEMNNLAARASDAEYVVFMNNDVELITEDWLETLVATVELDGSIAGVGAKLLYPDGTMQHGGLILGIGGLAGHAHRFAEDGEPGYLNRACLLNEFSGATAAMLLVRRSAFLEVGGFDADEFPTSFNDVDLWIRLRKAGHRCLYNPLVKAFHYESKSRRTPSELETEYENRLKSRWKTELECDRFYNPNLGLDNELFFSHRPFPLAVRYRKAGKLETLRFEEAENPAGEITAHPAAKRAA